jgi:hypothetical protein
MNSVVTLFFIEQIDAYPWRWTAAPPPVRERRLWPFVGTENASIPNGITTAYAYETPYSLLSSLSLADQLWDLLCTV